MKKITKGWSKDYGSLKIFRDDIEEINGIITSEIEQKDGPDSGRNKLTIQANEFILDGISELVKIKANYLRTLNFSVGLYDELSLYVGTERIYLHVQNRDNTKLMGIAMRIDAVLKKRLRFILVRSLAPFAMLLSLILGIYFLAHSEVYIALFLFLLFFVSSIYYGLSSVSTICLCYSHEQSKFFARNKDKILVNIVTAVFSFLLGIIGTLSIQAILAKSKDKAPPATSSAVIKEANEVSQKQPEK